MALGQDAGVTQALQLLGQLVDHFDAPCSFLLVLVEVLQQLQGSRDATLVGTLHTDYKLVVEVVWRVACSHG